MKRSRVHEIAKESRARSTRRGLGVEFRAGRSLGEYNDRPLPPAAVTTPLPALAGPARKFIPACYTNDVGNTRWKKPALICHDPAFSRASLVPRVRAVLACDTMMRARRQGSLMLRNAATSPRPLTHRPHRAERHPYFGVSRNNRVYRGRAAEVGR